MEPLDALVRIMQLPGFKRIQQAYNECVDAINQGPAAFRATVLRWLSDESLKCEGKSNLALVKGSQNGTLLHYAAMNGDSVVVEALLEHGADCRLRSNGMTPAEIANEYGQAHLLEREGRHADALHYLEIALQVS